MPLFNPRASVTARKFVAPVFSFTARVVPGPGFLLSAVAVNPAGIWVAGGIPDNASSDVLAVSSPDGITWTHRTVPYGGAGINKYSFQAVVWDGTQFYALISEISGWAILTSPGLANWVDRPTTTPSTSAWALAYKDDATKMFVVHSSFGGEPKSSPTAQTWTDRANPNGVAINQTGYGAGMFVAVGTRFSADFSITILTSPDGITWTTRDTPSDSRLHDVAYCPETGIWCAVGEKLNGDAVILTATDPTGTWTERANTFQGDDSSSALVGVAAFYGGFIAVGFQFNAPGFASKYIPVVYSSFDNGVTWNEETDHPYFEVIDVQYKKVALRQNKKTVIVGGTVPGTPILLSN